jgi:hypothetical protein
VSRGRLETSHAERLDQEIELRRQGYVPITSRDAPHPSFNRLLPACRVEQVVTDEAHGRLVWSHPGPSGLDARAIAPLALVRVADGLGGAPLDPPMTAAQAGGWLVRGDAGAWLRRRRHRVLLPGADEGNCLLESDGVAASCLTHPVSDSSLQRVADALGDWTSTLCRWRAAGRRTCGSWAGAVEGRPLDPEYMSLAALDVVFRLGDWHDAGVNGRPAWDFTRLAISPVKLPLWHAAGFSTEEASLWCALGRPKACHEMRRRGRQPVGAVDLPPVPGVADCSERGLHWYARFGMARKGLSAQLLTCRLCGARDVQAPCRSCQAEGRSRPYDREWDEYAIFARLGPSYGRGDLGPTAPCGEPNCRTSLALSAAGVEEKQP